MSVFLYALVAHRTAWATRVYGGRHETRPEEVVVNYEIFVGLLLVAWAVLRASGRPAVKPAGAHRG